MYGAPHSRSVASATRPPTNRMRTMQRTSTTATITPTATAGVLPLPPGPSRAATARWMNELGRNTLSALEAIGHEYGNLAMLRVGPKKIVIGRGADVAKHVLITAQDRYPKSRQFDMFIPMLGNGLVTSSGETWKTSRRIVQPVFAKRHLATYADHMASAAARALDQWDTEWSDNQVVPLDQEILQIGLDTVGRALATHDFSNQETQRFEQAMAGALNEIGEMSRRPFAFIGQDVERIGIQRASRLGTPRRWRRYLEHAAEGRAVIEALVDDRFQHGHGDRDDLLRLLMQTPDPETGQTLDRDQVIDELLTFLAAGHETTAHGLTWMFWLLGQHPAASARLHEEVDTVLCGRIPTAEDAESLPWLEACFKEAMRIYPPVWHIPRLAAQDDEISGFRIPQDTRVLISIWSTHRDPAVYDEPEAFRPERWLGDAPAERPRHAYLPFGGGRRACVGQGFAMLNALILGASMAQRYAFVPASPAPVRFAPSITLRPVGGVPVIAQRRAR
jgi:cytochrome P450